MFKLFLNIFISTPMTAQANVTPDLAPDLARALARAALIERELMPLILNKNYKNKTLKTVIALSKLVKLFR